MSALASRRPGGIAGSDAQQLQLRPLLQVVGDDRALEVRERRSVDRDAELVGERDDRQLDDPAVRDREDPFLRADPTGKARPRRELLVREVAGLGVRSQQGAPVGEGRHRTEDAGASDIGKQPGLDRIETSADQLRGPLRALERTRDHQRVALTGERRRRRFSFMTTAYMTRATYLTFFGKPRGAAAGEHHDEITVVHADVHATAAPAMALASHGNVTVADTTHGGSEAPDEAAAYTPDDPDLHGHDAHGHDAHGHEAHGHAGPHESPALITVPLVILAALAIVSGYLNAAPFKIEKFTQWVAAAGDGVHFPELAHAEFKWANTIPSILLVLAGFAVSLVVCLAIYGERSNPLKGLTRRVAPLRWGHTFLVNKYYLDALYEKVIVYGVAHPISKAAYWVNQNVLDGAVNQAGIGARTFGGWVYRNIDQRVVDGAVNGSGAAARGSGGALQPTQSGKVNQYGALLFGAAAIGALVLVIVNF